MRRGESKIVQNPSSFYDSNIKTYVSAIRKRYLYLNEFYVGMSAVEFKTKPHHCDYSVLDLRYANYFREGNEKRFLTLENTTFPTAEDRACYPTYISHITEPRGFRRGFLFFRIQECRMKAQLPVPLLPEPTDRLYLTVVCFHSQYKAQSQEILTLLIQFLRVFMRISELY